MESVERGRKILTELITKPTNSKKESILELKKEIIAAKKSGKTWKEIADALRSAEIETSVQTLSATFPMKKKRKEETKKEVVKKIETKSVAGTTEKKNVFASGNSNISADGSFKITPDRDVFKKSN